jgi:hypothetical protein
MNHSVMMLQSPIFFSIAYGLGVASEHILRGLSWESIWRTCENPHSIAFSGREFQLLADILQT